jgi:beta-glucosidase
MTFPNGFLWGASTAGHQVEGGNVNADMWPLEWVEHSRFVEPSGDACDHYHRYPEDIANLAGLGLNAYRFSLEWSRIEPEPGFFSRAALDHYRRMIACCLESGVTPVVTYNHFTVPRWFGAEGAWLNQAAPDRFGRYAEAVTARLGDLLTWVVTLNEPNVLTVLAATGVLPAGAGQGESLEAQADGSVDGSAEAANTPRMGILGAPVAQMAAAHRKAVQAIKSGPGDTKVGWSLALVDLQSVDGGEERWQQARQHSQLDWLETSRDDDFVGVQTYSRNRFGPDGVLPPPDGSVTMHTGWEAYQPALGHTVRTASEVAGVPVIVTENGMATEDDEARITYTTGALQGLAEAMADGVDVRGYLHWTLLDNFEWMSGYAPRFGLVEVDRTTYDRTTKASARWLGGVARDNGASLSARSER